MREAILAADWPRAWELSDEVLIESGNRPESLELVARAAFETGRKAEAAELLVEAARADGLKDRARIRAAFAGLLTVGRLFDGIDLLREAVDVSPDANELRRLLFDMLVATEQHVDASRHREVLIRQRAFDIELLYAAHRFYSRYEEVDSLDQMLERNPGDNRPLIGKAKRMFDERRYSQAIPLLERIVKGHPNFTAAQAMLGRALVASGEYSKLADWADQLPSAVATDSDVWLTLGDWALQRNNVEAALDAYGHAAQAAPDRVAPWTKLASLLSTRIDDATEIARVTDRAAALTRLRQGYAELREQDKPFPVVQQITHALLDLGKIWEAEAWAAYGTTLPSLDEMEKQSAVRLRAQVLEKLRANTPWQLSSALPGWSWLNPRSPAELIAQMKTSASSASQAAVAEQTSTDPRFLVAGRPILPDLKEEASDRGLVFFGRTADDLAEPGILNHQMIGCGGGTIDFDLDGWPDQYLVTAGGSPPHFDSAPNAMFRNLSGRFRAVSESCGAQDRGFGQGIAVGDVNEDGFDDLLVLNYGPNSLWINNGDGTFSDHSQHWLPANSVWSTSAAIADLDGDHLSDLFIANYCAGLEPTFEECAATDSGIARACSPNHFAAEPDTILKATPLGGFVDVTKDWRATPELLGRGLGVVAGSFDRQPGIDVLVANDMTSNHYWSQRQRESPQDAFELIESGAVRGLAHDGLSRLQGSMGIAVSDFNGDNVADFYVTNFEYEYNTLYLSRGDAGWNDETGREKLLEETLPMVGFGTQAVDFDHNGEPELIVTNGHVDHIADPNGTVFYEQPAQLFQRNPGGVFESVASRQTEPYFRKLHVGRGLWYTDANRDGRMDIVVTHQTEPAALLINHTDSDYGYISIRLVATTAARTGVGSVVTLRSKTGEATYLLNSGDGFLCSNERFLHAGLGEDVRNVDVTVRWLDGQVESWSALATGREWLLVQGEQAFEL